jgi:hypothetical protein
MTTNTKPPVWFTIVAVLALIWNAFGVMAYIMQVTMTPEALATLPVAEQALYTNLPAWYTGAFAIAVFGGALASLALVLKKGVAYLLFMISFAGILVQMVYSFFLSRALEVYGPGGLAMPVMVLLFGVVLIQLSRSAKIKGWIA